MVFGLFKNNDRAPQEDIDLARAHYVLRTAEPGVLAEILEDVAGKLSPEGREAWTARLVELGVGAGGDDHDAARGVVANLEGMDDEGRTAFADAVTPEVAEIIGHSHPAFAAFEGFPHSPEAHEVGEEDDHPANRDDSHAGEDSREGPVPGAPA